MYEHPTIYLELNIKATKKSVKDHINAYNDRMEEKFPKDYGKRTLKNMHVSSAMYIIEAYYAHLKAQAKLKTRTPMPFKLNNESLATMLSGTTVSRTAANHISRLIEAGIITEKKFLGTNTGYILNLNMELLKSMPNEEFRQKIEAGYQHFIDNGGVVDPENRQKIQNLTPSFSVFFAGMGKLFPDIVERTLKEHNINMQCGSVDNRASTAPLSQDAQINTLEINDCSASYATMKEHLKEHGVHTIEAVSSNSAADENPDEKFSAPDPAEPSIEEIGSREKIMNYTLLAWSWIQSNIYEYLHPDKYYEGYKIQLAVRFLNDYFQKHSENDKKLSEAFHSLLFRAHLVRNYVLRDTISRFIQEPHKWLDPLNPHGLFNSVSHWETNAKIQREKQKEYHDNLITVSDLYRKFADNPGIFDFIGARQQLGKKKDKKFLEMFDRAVIKHPAVAEIYQKMTRNVN